MGGGEPLPLDSEHPVPLQVAEDPVVAEDVEAVGGALEAAARLVAPVGPVADGGGDERRPLRLTHRPHCLE